MKEAKGFTGKNIFTATGSMVVGILLFCGLIGILTSQQILPEEMSSTICLILTEMTILLCCYIAVRVLPKKRLPAGVMLAATVAGLRLMIGTISFSEEELNIWGCILTLGIGAAAGIMASAKKQRRK